MSDVIEGPGWASHALDERPGRFPLSVEAHLMNMTARLVPGATTVTINARYYGLHGLVALESSRRSLDPPAAARLLRRCEVVVGGVSVLHPDELSGLAHGSDRIRPHMERVGHLDVAHLETPRKGYANPQWGFLGPYIGSELTLRILAGTDLTPGERLDEPALRTGFEGIFELAEQDTISFDDLESAGHLANGAGRDQPDGRWLAYLMCSAGLAQETRADLTRRGTVRLLARAADLALGPTVVASFRALVAYGPGLRSDPVVNEVPESEPWRGTLFRHDSVGAWRALWAWLVGQINGLTAPPTLVEAMIAALPAGQLGDFVDGLPATLDEHGDPAPAEEEVRAAQLNTPTQALALLALGARRSRELEGHARDAFVGDERRPVVLSPLWLGQWILARLCMPMSDVAAELVTLLLDRARRIALKKMRLERNGRVWLPTRVHERGEYLFRIGDEGSGNVGLRLRQLVDILVDVGVLDPTDNGLRTSELGRQLLGSSPP
jgi:hypothetical protein